MKRGEGGRGTSNKVAVIGAIERKGNVVVQVINNTSAETLQGFVRRSVDPDYLPLYLNEFAFRNKPVIAAS